MNKKSKLSAYPSEKILSTNITTLARRALIRIIALRAKQKKRTVIFTPNPQILLSAQKSKKESQPLQASDINIPDGIGVVMASRLTGGKIKARIGGIDLAQDILALAQEKHYKVFLLGSQKGVAKIAKKNLKKKYPALNICGTHHGYFEKYENEKIIQKINHARPDIIFVCMGYPRQEEWIIQNKDKLNSVRIFIGLGGSLDVWAQKAKRAPIPLRAIGLEWLYRTVKEPKRARIFFDIPRFLFAVWKSKNGES